MINRSVGRIFNSIYFNGSLLNKGDSYRSLVYAVLCRYQSQSTKAGGVKPSSLKEIKDVLEPPMQPKAVKKAEDDHGLGKYSSDEDDLNDNKWKLELAWVTKALEPALQFYRWAMPENKSSPATRPLADIIASIQRSKLGIQDWSLSDLTIGLYLVYLRQGSANPVEDVKGVQIFSEHLIQELIYHTELARGCYKDSVASLARHSMLREKDVIKFEKNSSVMRPGYYIGVDRRKKLVILGIRGTHTVYDLITDIVSLSDGEVSFEGYSTHFGTAEAARWFLDHEMGAIKKCLDQHEGFRLRLVGHSLGAAIASLLAIMLRKKSCKELGFDPNIVTAVGYATPPCVSKELAESCSDFVTTVVMQDDIIPRLSVASLARLRNEIVQTDWMTVLEKEDWKSFMDMITNAKQVMSSVQDAARKFADYAKFSSRETSAEISSGKDPRVESNISLTSKPNSVPKQERASDVTHEELYVPGSVYYLKRNLDEDSTRNNKPYEYFTLWRRHPGQHFKRILLSTNIISDHKCDSHILALRDVIKGLPGPTNEEQGDWFNRIIRSLQRKNDSTL